jgi:hypothetical protein
MTIGREVGMDRRTVKKLLFMLEPPRPSFREGTSILDDFKPIIEGQSQVDFAEARPKYIDGTVDKATVYFFILGFSRWKDADISENQRRKTLMYLIKQTFWKIGGVVKGVLFDNLTLAASRARTLRSEGELVEDAEIY